MTESNQETIVQNKLNLNSEAFEDCFNRISNVLSQEVCDLHLKLFPEDDDDDELSDSQMEEIIQIILTKLQTNH